MAQRSRFLEQGESEALKRQEDILRPFWRKYARPVRVHFASATQPRQVAHGLGVAPDGFLIVQATLGQIVSVTPEKWTADKALLKADVVDTRAVLIFFTLREDPIDV